KTGIATMGAIPCEVSEIYLPNESSETSHSSDLVKRKEISSIDGKMRGVSVIPSARTKPCAISRRCSNPQTARVRGTDATPPASTIVGLRNCGASPCVGFWTSPARAVMVAPVWFVVLAEERIVRNQGPPAQGHEL